MDITGWEMMRIARQHRVLRSFQKAVVFRALTVEDNLVLAGQMIAFPGLCLDLCVRPARTWRRVRDLREQAGGLLERVGLSHMRHEKSRGVVVRPAEAAAIRLHADAGAADNPARRTVRRHQSRS